jgi:hypothetical protein
MLQPSQDGLYCQDGLYSSSPQHKKELMFSSLDGELYHLPCPNSLVFLGRTKKSYEQLKEWQTAFSSKIGDQKKRSINPLASLSSYTKLVLPVLDGICSLKIVYPVLLALLEAEVPKSIWRRVVPLRSGTPQYDTIKSVFGLPDQELLLVVCSGNNTIKSIEGGPTAANIQDLISFVNTQ